MISTQTARKYLNLFPTHYKNEGIKLYFDGAVIHLRDDGDKKETKGLVNDESEYAVSIRYRSSNVVIAGTCTCKVRSFCKHQAAVLEAIIEGVRSVKEPMPILQPDAEGFRTLPVKSLDHFDEIIDDVSTQHFQYREDMYTFIFISNTHITGHKTHFSPYGRRSDLQIDEAVSLEIKLVPGGIATKCNECNKNQRGLCAHVVAACSQNALSPPFEDFINRKTDIQGLLQEMSKAQNISMDFMSKVSRVAIINDAYEIRWLQKNVILGEEAWFNISQSMTRASTDLNSEDSLYLAAKEKQLKDKKGNALVWPIDNDWSDNPSPRLISAKLNKDGTRLLSNVNEADYPSHATPGQKDFFNGLNQKLLEIRDLDRSAQIWQMQDFIDQHIDTFASWMHTTLLPGRWSRYGQTEIKKKDLRTFKISRLKADIKFTIEYEEPLCKMTTYITAGDKVLALKEAALVCPYFVLFDKIAYTFKSPEVYLHYINNRDRAELLFDDAPSIHKSRAIMSLASRFDVSPIPDFLKLDRRQLENGERRLYVKEAGQLLIFEPMLAYEGHGEYNILNKDVILEKIDNKSYILDISQDEVDSFIAFIDGCHDTFSEQRYNYHFYTLGVEDALSKNWFLDFFEICAKNDITVFGNELLNNFKFNKNKAAVSNSIKSGIDWFDINVDITFGKQQVPTARWIEAIRNKEKYVQLNDGSLGVLPEEWVARLEKIANLADLQKNSLKISKLSFNVVEDLFEELGESDLAEEIREKKERLQAFEKIETSSLPAVINGTLRDYQVQGYHWLKFLDEFKFGGCLADDMGLGKTLQVICFLADQKSKGKSTSLVVVPRSLLFNWAAELDKFCPALTYHTHHGPARASSADSFESYDIIISTYHTISNDIEMIRQCDFNYCILDESQAIKNPNSKRYKAMRLINASNRLVLTGTPIENNTFDLYAQFSFINPGLFLSAKSFKDRFATPIDVKQDQDAADLLRKMIYPFLLRRTKEQVAKDLPDKTESIIMCTMGAEQRKLYNDLRTTIKTDIESSIEEDGLNKSKFKILEGLLRLRQLCNAPQLVHKSLNGKSAASVKIETLVEQLSEVTTSHKALVFSQFVGMLSIIRKVLESKGIKYAYLDGSTKSRASAVNAFESDAECKVFLISLKAGNTGLNLVSAEYVYIVDPWWNPAVEAQAIDRTHRIGQSNNVFAYKMICKDTIEEKILKLQAKKKKIASDIIRTDENILKSLSKDNLMALFD